LCRIAMTLVGNEHALRVLTEQRTSCRGIDDRHQYVARAERILPSVPQSPNSRLREGFHQALLPLGLQFCSRHQYEHLDALTEGFECSCDTEHGLASTGYRFDYSMAPSAMPCIESLRLPGPQVGVDFTA